MTELFHFTHIEHLAGIVERGLVCDARAQDAGLVHEVGNRSVKDLRRRMPVRVGPGGVVADYVPFYFAPRSPMLYAIHVGNVPEYVGGLDPLVYLVTSVERLIGLGIPVVTTDRNAALAHAAQAEGVAGLGAIDWDLMEARMWNNTIDEPDRRERRMAECLVHEAVPWMAVEEVHVRTPDRKAEVETVLASARHRPQVVVTRDWYF